MSSSSASHLTAQLSRCSLRGGRGTMASLRCLPSSSRTIFTTVHPSSQTVPPRRPASLPSCPSTRRTLATTAPSASVVSFGLGTLGPLAPKKPRRRVGRGRGSGRGKTSGRGHNGQKARAGNGKPKPGFEGGQTPITRRFPKRGFTNAFAKEYVTLNVGRIQEWLDAGRLDPSAPITTRELYESACIHSYKDGVQLLVRHAGSLRDPVHLVVSRASQGAIEAVEAAGGSVVCKYYTANSLRALVKPHKFVGRIPLRDPDPIIKRELLYYANKANRGYLSNRIVTQRELEPKPDAGAKSKDATSVHLTASV